MANGQTVTPKPAETLITPAPPQDVVITPVPSKVTDVAPINAKLDSIVLPELKMENASLEDAVTQIRTAILRADATTPGDKQISILVKLTPKAQTRVDNKVHLTMDLKAESLRNILGVIAKESGLEMGVRPDGVTLEAAR